MGKGLVMQKWAVVIVPLCCLTSSMAAPQVAPDDSVSFSQARALILAQNAGLRSVQSEIDAAKEGLLQAGVLPNPSGSIGLERFGANEIEASIGQTIELGGKRHLRTEAAKNELEAVRNNRKLTGLELEAEIIRRFIPIAIISRKLILLDSIITTADATKEQIRKKVEAGATRKTDLIRAEIGTEQLAIERSEIVRKIAQVRKRFAALGGERDPVLLNVSGSLNIETAIPSLDDLRNAIKNSPRVAALEIQRSLLETQKRQLKAESFPDMNLSAGYINKKQENIDAPLVGLSMDIPIFNRNTAAQKQLEFQRKAISERRENELLILDADVQDLYSRLMEINKKIAALRTGTIPKAETVFAMLKEYYNAGSASFLDLTTAQSELLRLQMDLLDIEAEWAHVSADLMQTTSLPIQIVK
jgi:outer membrane protein, heavy metal efflux system